ncbi:hypothetical protein LUZ60_011458 [Juncus effusus]|nr:hypothetical protein LUZ60_011458 [Juncus effusus]
MESKILLPLYIFIFLLASISTVVADDHQNRIQNYVIFVRDTSDVDISNSENAKTWHISLLSTIIKDSVNSRFIYSYNKIANGFAARLTKEEVEKMSQKPWFARAVLANRPYKLMTTYTPEFLHLSGPKGIWKSTKNMGEGIIIGVIDSGISPGHPSFDDKDMPPPSAKWKGHCDFNRTVCNNKLIGAKSFLNAGAEEQRHVSPFDTIDHGTHTASIAAGAFVDTTSMLGNAMGLASGMAPRAHIAVYRVCTLDGGCQPADMFKAMEAAVNDGCDVLSLSLGVKSEPFYDDFIAMGGFYAILKGVFVSTAAGNMGPFPGTILNEAPWLLTVAASTTDRKYKSIIQLGNGSQIEGESAYQPKNWKNKMFPLVYYGGNDISCSDGMLDKKNVRGKIVLCDSDGTDIIGQGEGVLMAGGVGVIITVFQSDGYIMIVEDTVLPTSQISYNDGEKLKKYISSTKNPVATFLFRTTKRNHWSPSIARFSSRGPSFQSNLRLISKPDIVGPGVGIIAAIPPRFRKEKKIQFGIMSGTSMSCPHLSGIAALVKNVHSNWSPAAIKSAIMTTAYTTDLDGKPISDEWHHPVDTYALGAGHVDAEKALDPGLIYDIKPEDYIQYLCGLGYNDSAVSQIIFPAPSIKCSKLKAISQEQLNYPSISVYHQVNGTTVIYRTVTNVGEAKSTYKSIVNVPKGVSVNVQPPILHFNKVNEMKGFKIIFKWTGSKIRKWASGELKWVSNKHTVRSSIAIITRNLNLESQWLD